MKIFYSILFAILTLTVWTAALPTPRSNHLATRSEVRAYYDLDELTVRSVKGEGGPELVSRKIHIHISQRVKNAFKRIGNAFKKVGNVIKKVVKVATSFLPF